MELQEDTNNTFVVTWIDGDEAESAVYQLTNIATPANDNETTLDNLASTSGNIILTEVTDTESTSNEVEIELVAADDDDGTATIGLTALSGWVYVDRIATKEGMQIDLPTDVSDTTLAFTEEDPDSENIGDGDDFEVTMSPSDDGAEPGEPADGATGVVSIYPEEEDSDISIGYVESDFATYLEFNNVDNGAADLTVTYHPSEVYAKVYVTESKVTFGGGGGGGGSGTLVVTDAEVTGVQGKNLLVVGGSCVNTVAATLLGGTAPICEAAWTSATTAGAGAFLIQTFANPWTTGKVATLVAGYDAADTVNAVNALKTRTDIDTTVGKKYVALAGSTLQLVTV
jgi:hypothetical protein